MGPLVDTSVLVDYLRNASNVETDTLDALLDEGIPPVTAPVILQEVLQGYRLERDVEAAKAGLVFFELLPPPDYDLHRRAARLYREFRRAGTTSSTVDALIVMMALAHRCDLLTRDAVQRRLAEFAGVGLA
jgi:predicted nucleic acid-binding protein